MKAYVWIGVLLALGAGCGKTTPVAEKDWNPEGLGLVDDPAWGVPPPPDQTLERLSGYTFVEQQFRFANDPECLRLVQYRPFIQKLEQIAPREQAPGYWIDQIQAIKPPFESMERLPASTLYFDKQAVLNHWLAFQVRYPGTARQLRRLGYRPSFAKLGMPGKDIKRFARLWECVFLDCADGKNDEDYPPHQAVGDCLLYVDFLAAHGGRQDKWNACRLLREPAIFIALFYGKYLDSHEFGWVFSKEILWPLMAPENTAYWTGPYAYMLNMGRAALEPTGRGGEHFGDTEYIRACKWVRHNAIVDMDERMADATMWSNAYSAVKDHVGVFLCQHAGHVDGHIDQPTLAYMRKCLTRHFGAERGDELFMEYMDVTPIGENSRLDDYRAKMLDEMSQKR